MSDTDFNNARKVIETARHHMTDFESIDSLEELIFSTHVIRFPDTIEEWHKYGQQYFETLYMEKMALLAEKYPNDADIICWYGESLVNLTPWRYYDENRELKPQMVTAFQMFNRALEINPAHPVALHMLIHVYEQSDTPTDGEAVADKLAEISGRQGTTHFLHMPAHVYYRVGRYDDCIASGLKAITMDNMYIKHCFTPYVPLHNRALTIAGAIASGDLDLAIEHSMGTLELPLEPASTYVTALFPTPKELIYAKFGKWEEVLTTLGLSSLSVPKGRHHTQTFSRKLSSWLTQEETADNPKFITSIRLYAAALALLAQGAVEAGKRVCNLLSRSVSSIPPDIMFRGHAFYPYHYDLGELMNATAHASVKMAEGEVLSAVSLLRAAVAIQDDLEYMEPEHHYMPLRQCFAAVLMKAGERISVAAQESIYTYKMDLKEHPYNVW
eukprot:CAMPEP_0182417852 /NCGR_PEP_ID=MMETSP1167-20130531/2291_1 /TAXON_ID=2988 /ORGANISM="Mallomonas Sp, Strain CCMP3275" /LENGTH=441 /DNA_ID=CAMNT_0024591661 /DNA_START=501 /DNA_END=1823 /DNA_ORIENTATION=-